MADHKVSSCDLCGAVWDRRYANPGFRSYAFWVGEVFDGYDRWEDDHESILLCKRCQAKIAKALHGKGKIRFGMFTQSMATYDSRKQGA